jgi:hypothetical protein
MITPFRTVICRLRIEKVLLVLVLSLNTRFLTRSKEFIRIYAF